MGATVAIVLGAGKGARANQGINKVFLDLAGEPMIVRATQPFVDHPAVDEVVVVVDPQEIELCSSIFSQAGTSVSAIIAGGSTRHRSEAGAVQSLRPRIESGEIELVAVHDGARPMFDSSDLGALLERARKIGGAIFGLPVTENLVEIVDGRTTWQARPDELWCAQTPQAFRADVLLDAFDDADDQGFEGTDTAASVERVGRPVEVVRGQPRNWKIAFPEDLILAQTLLAGEPGG